MYKRSFMKRWVETRKGADFKAIADKYNISPILARIIRNRDVIGDDAIDLFLNGSMDDMHDPSAFIDIEKASARIAKAISSSEKIRIIGDYDIDGICAAYILKKSLSLMGADVDVVLPDRILDGYGINKNMISNARDEGISLIVTCDNGIAAAGEIEYASSLGIDVVVTDHHEVPYEEENGIKHYILPDAVAVIDPKREDCSYPYKGICGGMVAYKLVVYITSKTEYANMCKNITKEVLGELLTFAAVATVGDVMELLDENRIAVKEGLKLIGSTTNVGLRALMEVCNIDKNKITTYHIGFILGPCMNATGRLDSAHRALELFECSDYGRAVMIAQELKTLNDSRKNMTLTYIEEASKIAEECKENVLVIFLPECHESLAGIVAGRIKERFYKPTFILTRGNDGVKGSGRSIDGYSMFEELTKVKDIFIKYGGHKMAAGVSLSEDRIDELRVRLNNNCELTDEMLCEKWAIDMVMPLPYVTLDLAYEINKLEPFGVGNPRPTLALKDVGFERQKLVGSNQNVLKLSLKSDAFPAAGLVDAVMFDDAAANYEKLAGKDKISVLYQLDINSYMGRDKLQLIIKDMM